MGSVGVPWMLQGATHSQGMEFPPSHEQLEPCLHGMLCAQLQEQPGSRSRVVSRVMMGITAIDLVRGVGGGGGAGCKRGPIPEPSEMLLNRVLGHPKDIGPEWWMSGWSSMQSGHGVSRGAGGWLGWHQGKRWWR